MRRTLIVLALVSVACAPVSEPSTTTSSIGTTTTADAPTTSSTAAVTSTTTTTTTTPALASLAYEPVAEMPFPVQMTATPGSDHAYIATKGGRIWLYDGSSVSAEPVLDIRERVLNQGERGLLSIALHPVDQTRLFTHYTANDGDTVVSEFTFTDTSLVDPGSERVLMRLAQPAANHNGGMIMFNSDGALLVALGDGGGSNDRFGNGQNTNSLLAGLVRVQVDGDPSPTLYFYGLRNPWRFWLDGGLAYVADVGQNRYEEVTVVELVPGLNFGWPITEASHCFRPSTDCDTTGQVLPQVEVAHGDSGTCSITGGLVYRGEEIPELDGAYFYSDYCGGYLRSFRYTGTEVVDATDWTEQVGIAGRVVGFGVDGSGEMYVMTITQVLKVVQIRE